jgi:hypothetical protein
MSEPNQVKVSRDGKEIGMYQVDEALRLLALGDLKPTDHYWSDGMTVWALLSQLQAWDIGRKKAAAELMAKQEDAQRVERFEREKAKAKAEEERIVAENVRIEMGKRKANWFRCHCCRESFNEPKDPASDFGPAIAGLIFSGLLAFIPIVGWVVGPILAIYCFCIILASQIVAPYCPSCRSSNFSKPEKTDEQK